ncbi:MAG: hypothetical protein ACRD1E_07730, partial [Terriglobales bacterium]
LGTFPVSVGLATAASIGILVSTFYCIELVQRAFHGPNRHGWQLPDLNRREALALVPMMAVLLWLGLYPQPIFNTMAWGGLQPGLRPGAPLMLAPVPPQNSNLEPRN